MSRHSQTTLAIALLCAGCLLLLLPAVAQAQEPSTRTDYWIDDTDSSLAEVVVDDTVEAVPPDSGDWSEITLAEIHDLGRTSPSEDMALAASNGSYWQRGSAELGSNTVETAWFVLEQVGSEKRIRSGSGSRRIWYKLPPGYVYARTKLYKNNAYVSNAAASFDPWWAIYVSTRNVKWTLPSQTFHWNNYTTHNYGGGTIFGPDPDVWW